MESITALDPNAWATAIMTLSQTPVFWVFVFIVLFWIAAWAWSKKRKNGQRD